MWIQQLLHMMFKKIQTSLGADQKIEQQHKNLVLQISDNFVPQQQQHDNKRHVNKRTQNESKLNENHWKTMFLLITCFNL